MIKSHYVIIILLINSLYKLQYIHYIVFTFDNWLHNENGSLYTITINNENNNKLLICSKVK